MDKKSPVKAEPMADDDAKTAVGAVAAAAAPALTAQNMVDTLTQQQQLSQTFAAVAANPDVQAQAAVMLKNNDALATQFDATLAEMEANLLLMKGVQKRADDLKNLQKRVVYIGDPAGPALALVPVIRQPNGTLKYMAGARARFTVNEIIDADHLLVCPKEAALTQALLASGKAVDDVKIDTADAWQFLGQNTGARFRLRLWSGGIYHLWSGYSIEACRYIHRTTEMKLA